MRNQDEKSPVFLWYTTTHIPEITRVTLYYLGRLPNTSVEIGSKN
jgi:hypothetical protein